MTQYHPNQTVAPTGRGTSISVGGILILLLAVAVLSSGSIAQACSTPVYRYAMYNWQPSPY